MTKTSFDCLAEVIRALHAQQIPYMLTVRVVMAIQAHVLDWSYISRWAAEHNTVELLQQARADVGV